MFNFQNGHFEDTTTAQDVENAKAQKKADLMREREALVDELQTLENGMQGAEDAIAAHAAKKGDLSLFERLQQRREATANANAQKATAEAYNRKMEVENAERQIRDYAQSYYETVMDASNFTGDKREKAVRRAEGIKANAQALADKYGLSLSKDFETKPTTEGAEKVTGENLTFSKLLNGTLTDADIEAEKAKLDPNAEGYQEQLKRLEEFRKGTVEAKAKASEAKGKADKKAKLQKQLDALVKSRENVANSTPSKWKIEELKRIDAKIDAIRGELNG